MNTPFEAMKKAFEDDPQYAITWQANLAIMAIDAGADPVKAQAAAAKFMESNFGIAPSILNAGSSIRPPLNNSAC